MRTVGSNEDRTVAIKGAGFFHLASTAARVAAARGGNSPEKLAGARPGEGGRRGSS